MEELTKRNGKGVWMREIEKVLKRFDGSLEWLTERIWMREEEIEKKEAIERSRSGRRASCSEQRVEEHR